MRYGVDYYPEQWEEPRWAEDARLMREAGFDTVRMGEFAWARLEPARGRFDFSWLDRAIALLAGNGIDTVLGTPTAAPPKWVADESPDVCPTDSFGRVRGFGSRRHTCFNSPSLREHTRRLVGAMAAHYAGNPHVIGWQIDNELMGRCYCENCRKAFVAWLQKKYGTLEALNSAWGTVFWSQTYTEWNQLILPGYTACGISDVDHSVHNPGLELDYDRFCSDSILDFFDLQAGILRAAGCGPITHNIMPNAEHIDYYRLAERMDFASWDAYPVSAFDNKPFSWISMGHALTRSLKHQPFWVMEQESGPCGWSVIGDTPKPGQLRLWTLQSRADGAEGIVYFRWRPALAGTEEYWYGILDHDGVPRRRYREVCEAGRALKTLDAALQGASPVHKAAIVYSYDALWAHQSQKHSPNFEYKSLIHTWYRALLRRGIAADLIAPSQSFEPYAAVLVPALCLADEALREKLEAYVRAGGTLAVSYRSGIKTPFNSMTSETLPGIYRDLAGVELAEFDSLNFGRTVPVRGDFGAASAGVWCDILTLKGAQPVAEYAGEFYAGSPAITKNSFGRGWTWYFGCDLDDDALERYLGAVCLGAGVQPPVPECPEDVELSVWQKEGRQLLAALNHSGKAVQLRLSAPSAELFSGVQASEFSLEPYGAALFGSPLSGTPVWKIEKKKQ